MATTRSHPVVTQFFTSFRWFVCSGVVLTGLAWTHETAAQGPLRRLGERIRANVQQRTAPPSRQPAAPPSAQSPKTAEKSPTPAVAPEPARAAAPVSATNNRGNSNRIPNYNALPGQPEPLVASPPLNSPVAPANALVPLNPASLDSSSDRFDPLVDAEPHGRLGVVLEEPAPRIVNGGLLRPTPGALVIGTQSGSSAEAAGLVPGDRIVALNGQLVVSVVDFVDRLSGINTGDSVEIKLIRDNKLVAVTALVQSAQSTPFTPPSLSAKAPVEAPVEPLTDTADPLSNLGNSILLQEPLRQPTAVSKPVDPAATDPMALPADDYRPLTQRSIGPSSADAISPHSETELLPPPMADVIEDSLPLAGPAEQAEVRKPAVELAAVDYQTLMKEVEELRQRLQQFEAKLRPGAK